MSRLISQALPCKQNRAVYSRLRDSDITARSLFTRLIYHLKPLHVGFNIFFPDPQTGLFSVKIRKNILAIKHFSVNDTMSGQPNKRLIHWHFEN